MKDEKYGNRWWRSLTTVGVAGVVALVSACGGGDAPAKEPDPTYSTTEFGLQPATDCDQLEERVEDVLVEQVLMQRYSYSFGFGAAEGDATNAASGEGRASSGPDDYTKTNVQEEGVDEVDIVKTDGNHIFLAHGGDVVILKSWPAEETEEIARIGIGADSYSQGLFLHGDRLLAMSGVWDGSYEEGFSGTRISIIDISDPSEPSLERQVDVEGWAADARMIDGEVYLVTNAGLRLGRDYWDLVWSEEADLPEPRGNTSEAGRKTMREIARPKVRKLVREFLAERSVEELLPRVRTVEQGGDTETSAMYRCSDVYLPSAVAQPGMLNLVNVDLNDGSPEVDSTGVMANGWEVYASRDNVYVAMTSRWWWWGWGTQENETRIHKFGLKGPKGRPEYVASGKVDGWLLNQFSMSEHQGFLRVATTDNEFSRSLLTGQERVEGGNHLTILEQDDDQLTETGSVRNLAPGEQIYSARMMGDKGYMVTFRQTDPLFTFDLSDPHNPKLEGELKINGFSSYIHPLGADHLLTIGQDADDDGRVTGMHLQIFDVSDMSDPKRAHQEMISTGSWSSWSEAMWDHHAFTYHPGKGILAVPVNIHEWGEEDGENFSGLLVYKATPETGFEEVGRVDHSDLVRRQMCGEESTEYCEDYRYSWWTSVRRSIFMDEYLFSISTVGVKVNDLMAPQNEHAAVMLEQ